MTRREYLTALNQYLVTMSESEKMSILTEYDNHFRKGFEAGKTEAQISASLGSPYDVANEFLEGRRPKVPTYPPKPRPQASSDSSYIGQRSHTSSQPRPQTATQPRPQTAAQPRPQSYSAPAYHPQPQQQIFTEPDYPQQQIFTEPAYPQPQQQIFTEAAGLFRTGLSPDTAAGLFRTGLSPDTAAGLFRTGLSPDTAAGLFRTGLSPDAAAGLFGAGLSPDTASPEQ